MSQPTKAFLQHRPFGKQHPYDQEPDERFPREPLAGEPVLLGAKTSLQPGTQELFAVYQIGDAPEQRAAGKMVEEKVDYALWQVQLPAFEPGAVIRYHLEARGEDGEQSTDWFEFAVNSWAEYRRVLSASQQGSSLTILLGAQTDAPAVQLTLTPEESGTLNFRLSPASDVMAEGKQTISPDFHLDSLQVTLGVEPFSLTITKPEGGLDLTTAGPLCALLNQQGQLIRYQLAFHSPTDEAFYGFGERYNALDQRGNSLFNRVIDQYKRQGKRTYYPVPFFLSSRGYGLWVKTDHEIWFDLAEAQTGIWRLDSVVDDTSGELEIALLPQGSPKAVLHEFTRLTGRAKMPPSWVFGLWMSSNDWDSQAEVLKQYQLHQQHGIPATVLVIEAWADEVNFYIWNDAQYDLKAGGDAFQLSDFTFPKAGRWPDPKAMTDTLHAGGTRLILWQIPVLKYCKPEEKLDERQNQIDAQFWIENGLCATEADGQPYRVLSPWFTDSLLPDFTNPKTVEWWTKQREYLVKEVGVDGFKTDGSEHIWSKTVCFSDGSTGKSRCNSFPYLYLKAYDDLMERVRGKDHFLFSRSGYTGVQQFPGHWAGDEDSNWTAFRSSLYAMQSMSISGEPFVGWDIAGFGGDTPSAELYIRATAFSVFCPIMQYHSEYARLPISRDRTPWNIQERTGDDQVIPMFRKLTNLRMNLLPYIQYQAWLACQSGAPLMRALPLEFPEDTRVRDFPFEYCFGESLLAAPVVEEGKEDWQVYLPAGKWRDFWTQAELQGPAELTVNVPRDSIPVYQREGSILALNLNEEFELCSAVGSDTESYRNLALRIFPGQGCEFELVREQGERREKISARPGEAPSSWQIELPALDCPLELTVYTGKPGAILCDGKEVEWQWDEQLKLVRFRLSAENQDRRVELR